MATQLRVIQVACHSHELAGRFWRLVREWKVQSRGVHRDFRSSARESLASETSSREKHLANFFKSFGFKCFGGWPWRLVSVAKNTCFAFQRQFLILFYFHKNWKISKTVLPCFGDLVAGHLSRMLQPWARGLVLATCSQVKGLVMRGIQRFSWLSSQLPCEWDF